MESNYNADKLKETVTITIAEYERLLRDKTQLDVILQMYLDKEYNFNVDKLLAVICAMRGVKA